jgi:hypothetical protein
VPITIIDPGLGVLTPGAQITGSTDLIGPIPLDYEWHFRLLDRTSERVQFEMRVVTNGDRNFAVQWLDPRILIIQANSPELQDRTQAALEVQLVNNAQTVIESSTVQLTYDPTLGLPTIMQLQPQASGGLTQEEHTWLDTVNTAVQQVFQTAVGAVLSTPIGSLIAHPDIHLMNVYGDCLVLTGRGNLSLPSAEPFFDTYGVIIRFDQVPAGFGRRDGAVVEYTTRIAQIAPVYETNNTEQQYVGEVMDIYSDNRIFLWQAFHPIALQYDVTTGCTISLCWLTA